MHSGTCKPRKRFEDLLVGSLYKAVAMCFALDYSMVCGFTQAVYLSAQRMKLGVLLVYRRPIIVHGLLRVVSSGGSAGLHYPTAGRICSFYNLLHNPFIFVCGLCGLLVCIFLIVDK